MGAVAAGLFGCSSGGATVLRRRATQSARRFDVTLLGPVTQSQMTESWEGRTPIPQIGGDAPRDRK